MLDQQPKSGLSYHERLLERVGRPYIVDCPQVYGPDTDLVDAVNRGTHVSETHAFASYFERLRAGDPDYMRQVDRIVEARAQQGHLTAEDMAQRRLQFVLPAYREGENITLVLANLKRQFEQTGLGEWGVTFVFDHAVPYRNAYEVTARRRMEGEIARFLTENPRLAPYIDTISFTRRSDTTTPILPVGLARKVGEDVLMAERLGSQHSGENSPFYLGLMDCDLTSISDGVVAEILHELPESSLVRPKIVRVRGSFDQDAVKQHPELHPLQMMWEGMTSEVARASHNPFTVGRMSVVPARELAMTGGGFPRQLEFPDEDIRHGEQIAWQVNGVQVAEVSGTYATSPRREIETVQSLLAMLRENGGQFTMATLEYASLVRMYGGWADHTYRDEFGNITGSNGSSWDPLTNIDHFQQLVPPELIEVSANARYRFGLFSKFVVDELADHPDAPEITRLKERFLRGEVPSFMNEFNAVDLIRKIQREDPDRFARLLPALARADAKARQAIANILTANHILFSIDDGEPIYILEADMLGEKTEERDSTPLCAPIHIHSDLSEYMEHIRHELGMGDIPERSIPPAVKTRRGLVNLRHLLRRFIA